MYAPLYVVVVPSCVFQPNLSAIARGADKADVTPDPHHHNVMLHCPRPQETLPDIKLCCTHMHVHTRAHKNNQKMHLDSRLLFIPLPKPKHFQAKVIPCTS